MFDAQTHSTMTINGNVLAGPGWSFADGAALSHTRARAGPRAAGLDDAQCRAGAKRVRRGYLSPTGT
jgi:hypothetical protein